MSVVSVCSGKGSPGATFCGINLAAALARAGEGGLLLDLDPAGGDVAAYLDLDTRRGLYPLLRMDNGLPEAASLLAEADDREGVPAVCGFPEPSALSASVDLLARTIEEAGAERTVLCDLGRVTEQSALVAARSDLVLLVVRPDLVSVAGRGARAAAGSVEARSAGSHPKNVHPNAVTVMRERGIDLSGNASKHLSRFARRRFDHVITLCDRVREVCPEFPGGPERIHWSIADPALEGDTDEESYPAFQRTAAEIETRVRFLLHVIRQRSARR